MRFYQLDLTPPGGTQPVYQWTSYPNGSYDSKAQNILFDVIVTSFATPVGASVVTVEGVPLDLLTNNHNFESWGIKLYAGMAGGLPISNSQPPPSLIFSGFVIEGFGNWVGTEMTLTFFMTASTYTYDNPGNFVLNWAAGQELAKAIQQTLKTAYPGVPQDIRISSSLVLPYPEHGVYSTLSDFASAIKDMTKGHFLGANYPGVDITIEHGVITVWDGTGKVVPIQLKFEDLIGQPAWVESRTLYVMTPMRSDVTVGNLLKMPAVIKDLPGFVTTVPSFQNSYQDYKLTFQTEFYIKEVRHVGHFRSDDGQEWASVIKCVDIS